MSEVKRYWLPSSLLKDEAGWHQDDTCVVPDWAYDALAAQRDEGLAREAELSAALIASRELSAAGHQLECLLREHRDALQQRLAEAESLLRDASKSPWLYDVQGTIKKFLASPGCADGEKVSDAGRHREETP